MAKKSLVSLAKGSDKKAPAKKIEKKEPEKVLTPAEERDLKAKAKVEELLEGVELTPKKEDLLEIDSTPKEGTEWLEEQVGLLNEQVESLKAELEVSKADYQRLFAEMQNKGGNEVANQHILAIFSELQNNMLGQNQERTPWKTVNIDYLLKQMLTRFPVTQKIKKF